MSRVHAVFWLDLTLLLSMCALQSETFTGLTVHEWLAVGTIGLILVHLLLSWAWIAASSRRLLSVNANRTRTNYLLNFCLFASVTTVMFSGLMISEVALPALGLRSSAEDVRLRYLHNRASTFVVIFAGLHLAMNWDWFSAVAKRWFRNSPLP